MDSEKQSLYSLARFMGETPQEKTDSQSPSPFNLRFAAMILPPDAALLSDAMRRACDEARLYIGATSPNPPVGALALDAQGRILAAAAHRRAGTAHAEAALLKLCRETGLTGKIDTLCVTLEPCNHVGRTPPCTEAILAAKIRRVVVGTRDPNPHVAGGGCDRLRQAGVEVIDGVESERCRRLIHAFALHARTGRPFVTVKRAFDPDGSMIPPQGQTTFTSKESLILAHRLRKKADAILTGSGTILADTPAFTVRHVPDHPDKRRVLAILDRRRRVPPSYIDAATANGFTVEIHDDLTQCLESLGRRNIQDVLVEAGPQISQAVLDSPFWTLRLDIHQGTPDTTESAFNPTASLDFAPTSGELESLLPL